MALIGNTLWVSNIGRLHITKNHKYNRDAGGRGIIVSCRRIVISLRIG